MNEAAGTVQDVSAIGRGTDNGPLYLLIANEASAHYELDTIAALMEGLARLAEAADQPPKEEAFG